ncbi:MAG: phosphate ABC transporter substrate-binding protein [Gammaproteobacteria bacterium]
MSVDKFGSDSANTIPEQKLVLTGSSTVAPLAAEIGKRFETLHEGVRVDVQTGGSSRGVNDARAGLADIGMASRALKDDEQDLLSFTIALDGIGVIVNAVNPIESLDKQQIIDIYTGKLGNWGQVGGRDAPITVVNKAEGRSTLELFLHFFGLQNTDIKPHVVIGDNQQGIKTVAGNPDAIGYVSIGAAEFEAAQGTPIKLLPLDGVAASVENVKNRSFPLSRPLNLVTRTEPEGIAKTFIDFASSNQVNDLIEEQYFVPLAH